MYLTSPFENLMLDITNFKPLMHIGMPSTTSKLLPSFIRAFVFGWLEAPFRPGFNAPTSFSSPYLDMG